MIKNTHIYKTLSNLPIILVNFPKYNLSYVVFKNMLRKLYVRSRGSCKSHFMYYLTILHVQFTVQLSISSRAKLPSLKRNFFFISYLPSLKHNFHMCKMLIFFFFCHCVLNYRCCDVILPCLAQNSVNVQV